MTWPATPTSMAVTTCSFAPGKLVQRIFPWNISFHLFNHLGYWDDFFLGSLGIFQFHHGFAQVPPAHEYRVGDPRVSIVVDVLHHLSTERKLSFEIRLSVIIKPALCLYAGPQVASIVCSAPERAIWWETVQDCWIIGRRRRRGLHYLILVFLVLLCHGKYSLNSKTDPDCRKLASSQTFLCGHHIPSRWESNRPANVIDQ